MGHNENNAAARARLRDLIARLSDDDLRRTTPDGWTIAATLAHIAFWDRTTQARWRAILAGLALQDSFVPAGSIDWTNEAAAPQWSALPPRFAAEDAVRAAEAVDALIARLPDAAVATARGSNHPGMLDRTGHRGQHLDRIDAVLAARSSRIREDG